MTFLFLSLGCRSIPSQGTSVGNPTEMTILLAQSDEVEIDTFSIDFSEISFETNEDVSEVVDIETVIDQNNHIIEVPSGEWKTISFTLHSPLSIQGNTATGSTIELSIDLAEFFLIAEEPILFKENAFILELAEPNWLSHINAQYDSTDDVVIDSESMQHDSLIQEIQQKSSLFYDVDRDRQISDEERAEKVMSQDREWIDED